MASLSPRNWDRSRALWQTTLYIIRHGETIGNSDRILYPPNDDILNETGKIQANLLGESLKDVRFNKVYTSSYPRTQETARIILSHNEKEKEPETKVDSRLREIGLDNSGGKPYQLLLHGLVQFLNSGKPIDEFDFENSETIPEMRKRAKSSIEDLFKEISEVPQEDQDQTIMIVSHGAFIRTAMEVLSDKEQFDVSGWNDCGIKIMRNTSYMKLAVMRPSDSNKTHVEFQTFHSTSHLPKEMLENDSLTRMAKTPEGKCLSGCFQV